MAQHLSASNPISLKRLVAGMRYRLPEGRPLPALLWRSRHQGIVILLWAHALGLFCMGVIAGVGVVHSLLESGVVALAAVLAQLKFMGRRIQSAVACLGLISGSGILVHFAGGYVEMHFHFFVMIIVISLYQDWVPFLLTIGYVVLHHGIVGVLFPTTVYNHPDAWANPWKWALIHALFVVGACLASLVNWRMAEAVRAQSDLLLTSAGEGICGVDEAGRIAFVNPTATQLLGWPLAKMIGQPIQAVLRLQPADQLQRDLIRALASAGQANADQQRQITSFPNRNGTLFPAEYMCRPMHERGRLIGAVITFQDISARQEAEAEKLRYLEERKESQEQIIQLQQAQIANLSIPLIPILDNVVIMPLLGQFDRERMQVVFNNLLQGIETHQARIAILDITGVPMMDEEIARTLIGAHRATRLLGTELVLTGIHPEIAQALVAAGVDLGTMVTRSTLQAGVSYALERRGTRSAARHAR
jgi:PAS domain S-box-containing protein